MKNRILIISLGVVSLLIFTLLIYKITDKSKEYSPEPAVTAQKVSEPAAIDDAKKLFDSGLSYENGGNLLKAKSAYQKIIEDCPQSSIVPKAQEALENVNIKILFSPVITPDSFEYEVQKGDTLTGIARKNNTTIELIAKANGIKDSMIRYGKKLKITKAKFSIIVDKSQNILTLKSDSEILKTYKVSTGKDSSTPVGTFRITTKIVNPPWYPSGGGFIPAGDPRNILGSRWMGISKEGYGIHGTTDPGSIGTSVTEGCVRMKNAEVEELYSIVPEGTEVVIVE